MITAEELPNVEKHYRKHINNANGVIEYVSLQFDTEAKMMEWLEHYHQQKLADAPYVVELSDKELRIVSEKELQEWQESAIEYDGFEAWIVKGKLIK